MAHVSFSSEIELANAEDNQMFYKEVLPAAHALMEDPFGNCYTKGFRIW